MDRKTYIDVHDTDGMPTTVDFSDIEHIDGDVHPAGSTTIKTKDGRKFEGQGLGVFIGDWAAYLEGGM